MIPAGSPKSLVGRLTRGELQGYLALAFTALLFAIPFLRLPSTILETAIGLATLILALVFGIRGARFERGVGRSAGRLAMAAVFCIMAASIALTVIEFIRDLAGSRA